MKSKAIAFLNSLITDETTKKELDLIEYIKKVLRAYQEPKTTNPNDDWLEYFNKLWEMYPRKINKQLAKKTFEHKVRGLVGDELKAKCKLIYTIQAKRQREWVENGRDVQYIPHYSSFLNAEIDNSKNYKGR